MAMWNPNAAYRSYSTGFLAGGVQHKRKMEFDTEMPPLKMHITEEKMVSQLKGIHLSKDYTSHGVPTASEIELDKSIESKLDALGAIPSLSVCDEIRALQNKVEPLLPEAIMDRFRRPSTAVVLWRPPGGTVCTALGQSSAEPRPPQDNLDVDMNEEDDNNNASANNDMNNIFAR